MLLLLFSLHAFPEGFNDERTNEKREKLLKRQNVSVSFPKEGHYMFLFGLNLSLYRCGSLTFDVVLKFGIKVSEDDTISIIQNAIVDGKLGELSVNVSHIIGIPPVEQSTTTAVPPSTTTKSDGLCQILIDRASINLSALQLLF